MKKQIRLSKKTIINIAFIIGISAFCCAFIFNKGLVEGDDIKYHLYRIVGLADAFSEGQILPKIYPYANYGFGYASPLFYCDLFLYPFALLYKQGVGLIVAYKLMLLFMALLTSTIAFVVTKKIFKKQITPYVLTTIYMFSNYRFVNVVSRAAVGEIFAMAFIPLVLYAIYKLLVLKQNCGILLGVSFSLLVLSHVLSTVIMCMLFLIFLIAFCIKERNKKEIITMFKSLLVGVITGLLLTAWYLFPMIEQMLDQEFWYSYNLYYPHQSNPAISKMFHLFADMPGARTLDTVSIGLVLYLPLFLYIKVKKDKLINFLLITIIILFLFASGLIKFESEIKLIQFSFRLYLLLLPLIVFVTGYILDNLDKKYITCVCTILLVYSLINGLIVMVNGINYQSMQYNNYAVKQDIFEDESAEDDARNIYYNDDELSDGQYRPYEYVNYLKSATKYISYINDKNEPIELINDYTRKYTNFEFSYDFSDDETLELPILWYKGYKGYEIVEQNGNYSYVPINCYMNEYNKKVMLDVENGKHTYYVAYEGTGLQKLSLAISSVSVVVIIVISIIRKNTI